MTHSHDIDPARAFDTLNMLIEYARSTGHDGDADLMEWARNACTGERNTSNPGLEMMTPDARNQHINIAINRTLDNLHREITQVLTTAKAGMS